MTLLAFDPTTCADVARDQLVKSPAIGQMRTAFKGIASDASSEAREADLKHALVTASGSLVTSGAIYEHRASRWEEMASILDEREKVELLLRQTTGVELQSN